MDNKPKILTDLKNSIETWNIEMAKQSALEALNEGIDPAEALAKGLGLGMQQISQMFDEAKIYLPQVLAASTAMESALKILEPAMLNGRTLSKGTIVLGTVQGDIHEIGKNVVGAMLRGGGYHVIDLGRDVSPEKFVAAARTSKADMVGASALMTTTVTVQKDIVEMLKEEKLETKTVFGGAPCNPEWVKNIGGDLYCPSGAEVVGLVNQLMEKGCNPEWAEGINEDLACSSGIEAMATVDQLGRE
jgi:corrinoid protein of di/trimethylamine methyltransferase